MSISGFAYQYFKTTKSLFELVNRKDIYDSSLVIIITLKTGSSVKFC